mgnify:FL=1
MLFRSPCAAFGLERPALRAGQPANLALWDLDATWRVGQEPMRTKGLNTCFKGRTVRGRCLLTIAGGALAHEAEAKRTLEAV